MQETAEDVPQSDGMYVKQIARGIRVNTRDIIHTKGTSSYFHFNYLKNKQTKNTFTTLEVVPLVVFICLVYFGGCTFGGVYMPCILWRLYLWWSLYALYLLACQTRVTLVKLFFMPSCLPRGTGGDRYTRRWVKRETIANVTLSPKRETIANVTLSPKKGDYS